MGALETIERRSGASLEDPHVSIDRGTTLFDMLGGRQSASGKRVNQRTARRYSAVYSAIDMISGWVGVLPLNLYQRRSDRRGKDLVRTHPGSRLSRESPNREMSAIDYKTATQGHLLTRGNKYAEIQTSGGQLEALWPLHPDKVELVRDQQGTPFYRVRVGAEAEILDFDQVLHIRGLGLSGREGWSPIKLARESIGLGLATEEFGSRFFGNNSTPRGVLSVPDELNPEGRKKLKKGWQRAQGGLENAHRVAVLEHGIEWQQIGLSAEDSQFLETRRFQVREIARWFKIPPHKLRDMQAGEPNSLDEQNLEFLQDTLEPWLVRWEQAFTNQLLTPSERDDGLFFEFDRNAVLQADSEGRASMYQARFNTGSMTPNEIRAKENENPLPEGGDEAYLQVNMAPLSVVRDMPPTERALYQAVENGDPDAIRAVVEARQDEDTEDDGLVEQRQTERRLDLVESFLPVFQDSLRRMVRGEVQDIRSELSNMFSTQGDGLQGFLRFLDTYYSDDFPGLAERTSQTAFRSFAEAVVRTVAEDLDNLTGNPAIVARDLVDQPEGYWDKFVNEYAASSRRQLQASAQNAAENPEAPEPDEAVDQRLTEWQEGTDGGRPRHERWADKETHSLHNASAKAAFAAGGIMAMRWAAVGQNCPMCNALDGTVVSIQSSFVNGGDTVVGTDGETEITPRGKITHPPLHSGCDCLILPR